MMYVTDWVCNGWTAQSSEQANARGIAAPPVRIFEPFGQKSPTQNPEQAKSGGHVNQKIQQMVAPWVQPADGVV